MEFVSFENVSTCTTCSLKRLDFVSHKAYAFPNPSSVCIYVFFVEFPITRFRKIQFVYWIFIVCIYLKQQTCWMFFFIIVCKSLFCFRVTPYITEINKFSVFIDWCSTSCTWDYTIFRTPPRL